MKYIVILAALLMATVCGAKTPEHKNDKEQPKVLGQNPKREFRGAWIQCVNNQWTGIGRERMQNTLIMQLDELKRCGINAIMFQVRAEADALYESKMEPWSRYLTAEQGRAPQPYWDPLAWMVEECHRRGMECHAWINPYRAKTKGTMALSAEHPYFKNPERFLEQEILNHPLMQNQEQVILCTTIETNRDTTKISKAPTPMKRAEAMVKLSQMGFRTMATTEPCLDFDLDEMVALLKSFKPEQVNVGCNSNPGIILPEPSKEKLVALIHELREFVPTVELKSNSKRILGDNVSV